MTGRTILPRVAVLLTGKILSSLAGALGRQKADLGISTADVAELAGKSDRKSGQAYLAGDSDMGFAGFIKFTNAVGAECGVTTAAAFVSDALRPLTGLVAVPDVSEGNAVCMDTVQLGLASLNLEVVQAWADRQRTHRETLAIADKLRPLLPHFQALVAEADRIRGN
jgi:hypothetical protein